MSSVALRSVTKRFGAVTALDGVDLEIGEGEFFVILGPPGAGKTTTLRTIVGLERPDEGQVLLDGRDVAGVAPGARDVGIVFQNLALYPDKTVYDNLAFPLRQARTPRAELDERVRAAARMLRIEPLLGRKPARLSGGERQRVAIGRVITRAPGVYLLDEPLSALDALLRIEMRAELKHLQRDLGRTLVYVTHDQVEAMSMADRICVLSGGRVQQVAPPGDVYDRPANATVARTVGSPPMNLLPVEPRVEGGRVVLAGSALRIAGDAAALPALAALAGQACLLGFRPEDVLVGGNAPEHAVCATVMAVEPLGGETIVDLDVGGALVKASLPPGNAPAPDERVAWAPAIGRIHVFGPDGGAVHAALDQPGLALATPVAAGA